VYERSTKRLHRLLARAGPTVLSGGLKGVERETLRVDGAGGIAGTPHPRALGSPLTNRSITTDYSEALLEVVTPPFERTGDALEFLLSAHQFVYRHLEDELLWAASMPCLVGGEESIPIATYGRSNIGRMKHLYRVGLGHRYGRVMQVIAGTHFNYSLPDGFWPVYAEVEGHRGELRALRDDAYFDLIRNLQRFGWIVPYLFGTSPAICKSFLGDRDLGYAEFDPHTWYLPEATSLRMSDIGYKNKTPEGLKISYDSLEAYVASLERAITTPYPEYEKIGVKVDGEWRQLNANFLQIENEYYSTMRAKQTPGRYEKPTAALRSRGVLYVELRSVDIDAFEPLGVGEEALRFLEAFLVFCLLEPSPRIDDDERREIEHNQVTAAVRGRAPDIALRRGSDAPRLAAWAREICDALEPICEALDAGEPGPRRPYALALAAQREKVLDPERTPSARTLSQMRESGLGFFHYAMSLSRAHAEAIRSRPGDGSAQNRLAEDARASLAEQRALEAGDHQSFDDFLAWYFAQGS